MEELYEMYPYERDMFVELIMQHLKQVEEEVKKK